MSNDNLTDNDPPTAAGRPTPICSEIETALLRAMRRNHELVKQYHKAPATVEALKDEIRRGAVAFAEADERSMEWLTRRMNENLEALPEWR
jgi:hypothetical protein